MTSASGPAGNRRRSGTRRPRRSSRPTMRPSRGSWPWRPCIPSAGRSPPPPFACGGVRGEERGEGRGVARGDRKAARALPSPERGDPPGLNGGPRGVAAGVATRSETPMPIGALRCEAYELFAAAARGEVGEMPRPPVPLPPATSVSPVPSSACSANTSPRTANAAAGTRATASTEPLTGSVDTAER